MAVHLRIKTAFVSWLVVVSAVAVAWGFDSASQPHPAIVEVIATDPQGIGRGSGTLVYVDDTYGYVLTNWHVVEEAGAQIDVRFPNGFRSPGTIVKTDDSWDLALVRIWQPNTDPLPVATIVPQPGDVMTIAGYGQGQFRAAQGKCIHYAAPDAQRPFEMIEVSVEARQGDSGGPILNERGELAGVLFGAGDGATTGSHIGRVKTFLDATFIEQQQKAVALAASPAPPYADEAALPPAYVPGQRPGQELVHNDRPLVDVPRQANHPLPPNAAVGQLADDRAVEAGTETARSDNPFPELAQNTPDDSQPPLLELPGQPTFAEHRAPATNAALPVLNVDPKPQVPAYRSRGFSLDRSLAEKLWEATKSVLAVIGAITIVFQFAKASLRRQSD